MYNLKDIKHKIREDLQSESFAEYAEMLRISKKYSASIRVCLDGLSKNPSMDKGRLVLARTYYDCGYVDFALRELTFLSKRHKDNIYIKRLIDKITCSKNQSIKDVNNKLCFETNIN